MSKVYIGNVMAWKSKGYLNEREKSIGVLNSYCVFYKIFIKIVRLGKQDFQLLISSNLSVLPSKRSPPPPGTKLSYHEFSNCAPWGIKIAGGKSSEVAGLRGGVLITRLECMPPFLTALCDGHGGSIYTIESSKPPNQFLLESSLLNIYQHNWCLYLLFLGNYYS